MRMNLDIDRREFEGNDVSADSARNRIIYAFGRC